jgi:hypothetical protein
MSDIAILYASVAGGSATRGHVIATIGQSIQFSRAAADGVRTCKYELYSYPPSYACPVGWTDESGVYTYTGNTPPAITVLVWGKYIPRLRFNGVSDLDATGQLDSTTGVEVYSPSGLRDIADREEEQFGGQARSIQDTLRVLDTVRVLDFRLDEMVYDEDLADVAALHTGFVAEVSGTGAAVTQASINTFNGCAQLSTGTTSIGYAALTQTAYRQFRLGHGDVVVAFAIKTASLSSASDAYTVIVGLTNSSESDSVLLRYTHSVASGMWTLDTKASSSTTSTSTGVTFAATTVYRIALVVNEAGTVVSAYINGVLVGSNTTTIPTVSASMGMIARITKSVGTTARLLYVSKIKARIINTYESLV